MAIAPDDSGIRIRGHVGTWHALYSYRSPDGVMYHVLEHEHYGSEAPWLYVDTDGESVSEEIENAIVDGEYEEVV